MVSVNQNAFGCHVIARFLLERNNKKPLKMIREK